MRKEREEKRERKVVNIIVGGTKRERERESNKKREIEKEGRGKAKKVNER